MTDIVPNIEGAVRHFDALARSRWSYKADPPGNDNWRSHADDVLAGRHWEGDCDDLASTALDLMMRGVPGIPQDKLFRMCVKTRQCPAGVPFDHMVAGCLVRPGALVLFGDTFGDPQFYAHSTHRVIRYASVAEGVVWRNGHP